MYKFSIAPYFDDFSEEKGFLKVLFIPKLSVQTREVNQVQSIILNQIKKFGDSIYKHGSPVKDGNTGFDLSAHWVSIVPVDDVGGVLDRETLEKYYGMEVTGSNTGVKAIITSFYDDGSSTRLFIKYTAAGKNSEETFAQGEILEVMNDIGVAQYQVAKISLDDVYSGIGSRAYISDGVYYIDGLFVNVYRQEIILDPDSNEPSVKVGLEVQEEIITTSEDSSLYDNAAGTTNYTAPGADRYKITLKLVKMGIDEETDSDKFIELLRLERGNPEKWVKYAQYSVLGDTMARRTYDESGNYVVNGLGMTVAEHLDTGDNNGIYTEDEGGDSDKFVIRVSPGKAYIRGYEIEKTGTTDIAFEKSRDVKFENNSNVIANWSTYLLASDVSIVPNIRLDVTAFLLKTDDKGSYQDNILGWCKIRGIEREYGTGSDLIYRLYVYDINMLGSNNFSMASALYSPGSEGFYCKLVTAYGVSNASAAFTKSENVTGKTGKKVVCRLWNPDKNILYANKHSDNDFISTSDYITGDTSRATGIISSTTSIYNSQNISMMFQMPYNDIQTLRSTDGTSDTTYITTKVFEGIVLDENGAGTISTYDNDSFVNSTMLVSTTDGSYTTETTATIQSANTAQVSLGNSYSRKEVRVIADVQRNGVSEKKKQYRETSLLIKNTRGQRVFSLGKSDIYKVTGVWISDSYESTPDIESDQNIVEYCSVDDGQRDAHYRNAILTLPTTATGQVRIDFSYFDVSGTGNADYCSIDSYNTLIIDDKDYIESTPTYRIGSNEINLRNYLDFRPRVMDNTANRGIAEIAESGTKVLVIDKTKYPVNDLYVGMTVYGLGIPSGTKIESIDEDDAGKVTLTKETTSEIPYGTRILFGISETKYGLSMYNSSSVAKTYIPKSNTPIRTDFYHYIGRCDVLSMKDDGDFQIQKGVPAINPKVPSEPDGAMAMAYVQIPAYTYSASDVKVNIIDNKRYTMRDIGNLERRIENLEYVSSLTMLESNMNNIKITDSATGLDRMKTGILADDFNNSSMADVTNIDLLYTIDLNGNYIFPAAVSRVISLNMDSAQSSGYTRKTGKITNSYEEVPYIANPYSSKSVNINAFMYANWVGDLQLSPNQDFWVDEKQLPDNNVTIYDQSREFTETIDMGTRVQWAWFGTHKWGSFRGTTTDILSETTEVVPVDYYTETNVVGTEIIPYIRSRRIKITGTGFKPNTRIYPFFDGRSVSEYCTISGSAYNEQIVVSETGSVEFYFDIPEGVFKTGEREFAVSNQQKYSTTPEGAGTYGSAIYTANGTLELKQDKNTTITTTKTTVQSIQTYWYENDPLAQSFYIPDTLGCMVTSVDLFFRTKHSSIPVVVELREMGNGYPSPNLLIGGKVTLYPDDISISEDSSVATRVTFPYPIYLEGGREYCIVLITDCPEYEVWCSGLGESDMLNSITIDKQPVLGSLFKSQNNKTWTADQNSDLKYTLYRAKFDTTTSAVITFVNDDIPAIELASGAVTFTKDSGVVEIKCLNHGLFDTSTSFVYLRFPEGEWAGISSSDLSGEFLAEATDNEKFRITLKNGLKATEDVTPVITGATALINYGYDSFVPNLDYMQYQGTSVQWSLQTTSGKTVGDNTSVPYNLESSIGITYNRLKRLYMDNTMVVASSLNEQKCLAGNKSLKFTVVLSTESDLVSPMLYCNDFGADSEFVLYDNIVNNPSEVTKDTFLGASGTENRFNFITIPVNLELQATMLKVYVEANVPTQANLRIFYRATNGADSEISSLDWIELERPETFKNSNMFDTPYDYEFTADNIPAFSTFQIKISGQSSVKSRVPVINNYRVLALA